MIATQAHYGVIFATSSQYHIEDFIGKLTPKSLQVAIKQAVQYEEHFGHGATAHVIDLETNEEVLFDRVGTYQVRGRVKARMKPWPIHMLN